METVPYNSHRIWPEIDPIFSTTIALPDGRPVEIAADDTAFGFVYSGIARSESRGFEHKLHTGMFFSLPGPATLTDLHGFVCTRRSYRGLPTWGGPIETLGRLKYINGCSDTLLLAPPVKGDPCLNYLYIPPRIDQTPHTHPTARVGCITGGAGSCITADKTIELLPGTIFVLPKDEIP